MARKQVNSAIDDVSEPDWPTQKKKLLDDGRAIGINNSVWLYRGVDMSPVDSAKTVRDGLLAAAPLENAFTEISRMTQVAMSRRSLAKSRYRDVHVLLINIPERFNPSGHIYEKELRRQFPKATTQRRILLFGVRLNPSLRAGGWREALDSIIDTFDTTAVDVNLNEYARDYAQVDAALTRAGLYIPSAEEFRIADSWWNAGRFPDTPYLVHNDHLHMFTGSDALADAKRLHDDRVDCRDPAWMRLPQHHTLSMVSYSDMGTREFAAIGTVDTHWCSELLSLGAVAVSVRGKVEPGKLTHNQIRAGRKTQTNDLLEAERDGTTLNRADQENKARMLEHMEEAYSGANAPVTLIEASIIAALSGANDTSGSFDVNGKTDRIVLANMGERQEKALSEMMMCSQVRANPNLKDLPTPMISYSGLPSLSIVGDKDGALLGFTEHDRQPAYVSSNVASATDSMPLMAVVGQTGSGKLMSLDHRLPTPSGWKAVRDLEVGDTVIGRNGKVTPITSLSPIVTSPKMYAVTLSDGQTIRVDYNHQFVVSSEADRRIAMGPDAVAAWSAARAMTERLREYARTRLSEHEKITASVLFSDLRAEFGDDLPWRTSDELRASLDMMFLNEDAVEISAALPSLANRLGERYYNAPLGDRMERRMTTGEMLASGQRYFIHAPAPIDLPDADLGGVNARDLAYRAGMSGRPLPEALLRGSIIQRAEAASALVASFGRHEGGEYALSLDEGATSSALELLRSLGIIARLDDVTIRFATALFGDDPVGDDAQWLEIVGIEPTTSEPARCITVADSDHAYLLEGFIPQSNTQALLWLAYNWAQPTEERPHGVPQVIVDPKLLRLNTPIPTPNGWTTVRDIEVGDEVYDRCGQPCTVVDKSKVYGTDEIRMRRLRTDDGQEFYADEDHQWIVQDAATLGQSSQAHMYDVARINDLLDRVDPHEYLDATELLSLLRSAGVVRYTRVDEVADALQRFTKPSTDHDLRWKASHAVRLLADQLTEEAARNSQLLGARTTINIATLMERGKTFAIPVAGIDGEHLDVDEDFYEFGVSVANGLNDAIPATYERASRAQRLALVRGFMDVSGEIRDRHVVTTAPTPSMQRAIVRILRSLGVKTLRLDDQSFSCDTDVRLFERSPLRGSQPAGSSRATWLTIREITPAVPEPGQCLSVNSPDHSYLAGDFVVTHNTTSDHGPMVESVGGTVMSLDELQAADGALDPMRFAGNDQAGVDAAVSVLVQVNPWGREVDRWEADLSVALAYGAEHGARCTGRALEIALEAGQARREMVDPIFKLADRMAKFRAIVGRDDSVPGLRVSEGITLIKLGKTNLDLPEPGQPPNGLGQRIDVALVRMMVFGSAMALAGRSGVLHFDEAWIAMSGGAQEVQRLGRLARSQDVLPILYTQRVSDLVNNDMTNYISRGLILAIADFEEAKAACLLFDLEPTQGRLDRIRAKDSKSTSERTRGGAPNYNSLRALFVPDPTPENPKNRKNIRGSVAFYCDIQGRVAPVEIRLPEEFLFMTSTTPEDIRRRDEFLARKRAEEAELRKSQENASVNDRRDTVRVAAGSTGASAVDGPTTSIEDLDIW